MGEWTKQLMKELKRCFDQADRNFARVGEHLEELYERVQELEEYVAENSSRGVDDR